ncbi:hypothetical protein HanRHA438_Chr16g0740021 [Helianthus annuus]|nr:hypothetical protein HanRHA438_Chr16g0740021 [Helianthus annuus]
MCSKIGLFIGNSLTMNNMAMLTPCASNLTRFLRDNLHWIYISAKSVIKLIDPV